MLNKIDEKTLSLQISKVTYNGSGTNKSVETNKTVILHIITNVNIGGAEITLLRTMKHFDKGKFNHIVLTLLPKGYLLENFKKIGVEVHCLGMKSRFDILALFRYFRFLRKKKPKIVVAYLFHALSFAVIGKIFYSRTILIHYKRSITFSTIFRDKMGKVFSFFIDYLIGISKGVVDSEPRKFQYGFNSFIVYNGIELPSITSSNQERTQHQIIIGTIARLNQAKGLRYLIESARRVKLKKPSAKFLIIGGGELYSSLREAIERKGLENYVKLEGEQINTERYFRLFDIFVLPSLYEGLGNVLLEAMSYGIPVIGTNVSGINEIIKNSENGLLIEPKSSEAITEAIVRLIEKPILRQRLGQRGRKTVERVFTIERTVNRLESIFAQILEKDLTSSKGMGNG